MEHSLIGFHVREQRSTTVSPTNSTKKDLQESLPLSEEFSDNATNESLTAFGVNRVTLLHLGAPSNDSYPTRVSTNVNYPLLLTI